MATTTSDRLATSTTTSTSSNRGWILDRFDLLRLGGMGVTMESMHRDSGVGGCLAPLHSTNTHGSLPHISASQGRLRTKQPKLYALTRGLALSTKGRASTSRSFFFSFSLATRFSVGRPLFLRKAGSRLAYFGGITSVGFNTMLQGRFSRQQQRT